MISEKIDISSCGMHQDIQIFQSCHSIQYPDAIDFMETYIQKIIMGHAPEAIWFLEHPDIYTAGTSANKDDLLDHNRFPVYQTGRGGQYTYHGPGQLIVYVMLDIKKRFAGVKEFVKFLENWIISTLALYNILAFIREKRVGVWIPPPHSKTMTEDKIAAIGIRIRRGISFHGISINLAPNLHHFNGIVPCGLTGYGITSIQKLGHNHDRFLYQERMLSTF